MQLTDKEKRKQTKRLKALAHAVLETITTSELWTLPTTTVAASTSVGDIQQVSANALKGNAVLLGCLLRLIGTFVALLPKTQQDLLPIILYPVFEKQSCHRLNHSHVRAHAHKTLLTIAAGIRLPDLVDSHFDYLFGALLAGIRGENSGNEAMMAVTNTARVVLNTAIQSKRNSTTRRNLETRTNSSSAVDFMTALIRWFDRNQQHQSETIIVDLLRLMESTILFMGHSFGLTVEGLVHGCRQKSSEQQDHEPWNKWVDRFIVRNEERCPETGFHSSVGSTAKDDTDKLDITPEEIDLLSLALARCAYFMGHPTNLAIRVQSCLTQTKAFQFLGFVASNHNNEEEANGPKTAVYRQINESWPAMSARLKSLTEEFVASHRVHRALSKQGILQQRGPTAAVPSGKNIAFLSNLLDLIGAICDVSDDFMFRRLREEVNPCITKLLRCFVEQRASSAETIRIIAKSTHTNVNNGTLLLPEKEKLLVSVLRFLTRIFSQRDLGTSISKFAIMVLPFLDEPTSAVGDATIEALKAMAEVNADSLWIVLSTSAGNGTSLLFETRMRELLTYADGLPEQALD